MALYDDTPPPNTLRKAFESKIEALPVERLIALARIGTLAPKGFRIDARRPKPLQHWLLQRIYAPTALPDGLLRLLVDAPEPAQRIVALLDAGILRAHRSLLMAALGADRLEAALRVDSRSAVRALAESMPQAPEPVAAPDAEDTLAQVRALLAPLAALLAVTPSPPEPPSATPHPSAAPAHAARRIRALEQRVSAQRDALAQLRAETRHLSETHDALRAQYAARNAQHDTLKVDYQQLQDTLRAQIDVGVNRRLQDRANRWMTPLETSERAVTEGAGTVETLLARAAEALRRQGERDRHSGNRALLRERRTALRTALGALREAAAEALNPLPELLPLAEALEREIHAIDRLLNDRTHRDDTLPARLVVRIQAADPEALPELREGLRILKALKLCDADALAEIDTQFARRQHQLLAPTPADPVLPKDVDPEAPGNRLRAALRGAAGLEVLIDGHNTLFALRLRYAAGFVDAIPSRNAREALIADVRRMIEAHPDLRIRLVYDGPERSDRQVLPNLIVTYSGGEGEDRADRVLLAEATFLTRTPGLPPVIVVTEDQAVAFRARGLGAGVMTPAGFMNCGSSALP